jgi:thiamine-phosphate pyrophosphorylase
LKNKIVKKKNIYLISPNRIKNKNFYKQLEGLFRTKKISFFQLRLKRDKEKNKLIIGKKIKKICKKYKVKFIVNDDPVVASKLNSDGCHLGQKDMKILKARKILKNKIIGITCHNSLKLVKKAIKNKANYIAIGAFNSSKTKKIKFKANIKLLKLVKKITNIPIVVIGGINHSNYKNLLLNKANFLAISGYIWKNKKYKPIEALEKLK